MSFENLDSSVSGRQTPVTRRAVLQSTAAMLVGLAGCESMKLRSQSPDDDDEIKAPQTTFIQDQVTVSGLHPIAVETVGLVTGLDGTGGDSPPSMWRTMVVDEMRRRNVKNPNTLLKSPNNAVVIVRAQLHPVIEVGDPFDVEVVLPENSEATSLKGGWLMLSSLSEQAIIPGRAPAAGHVLGLAEGPIMLSTGEGESASQASVLKRGRVLGGGRFKGGLLKKDREMGLYLRNDLRSVRQSRRIAAAIGKRFYHFQNGIKKPLAEAKTDQYIELKVHPSYKENYIRYVKVIHHIALNEGTVDRRERIERLRKTLMVPHTAGKAAMELEAIGNDAKLVLKDGLKSPSAEVRFYSADALAYLGDSSGTKELAEAARNEEAFRIFALAALATLDDSTTRECLKDLMTEPTIEVKDDKEHHVWSAETRYGAFRTLWTIDKRDPFLHGEALNKAEYRMHSIKSDGEPMVHLSTHRVPEIVLFDDQQRLRTPLSLSAGRHIMVTAPAGSDTVTVSRFMVSEDKQLTCSTRLDEVIRTVAKLDASYPDVAQMLVQAQRQECLSGRLELDALPQAGRLYHRPPSDIAGNGVPQREATTTIGKKQVPNMFQAAEQKRRDAIETVSHTPVTDTGSGSGETGEASVADVSQSTDTAEKPPKKSKGLKGWFSR